MVAEENTNIVKILDELYRNFDLFCVENSVQKIEVKFTKINIKNLIFKLFLN